MEHARGLLELLIVHIDLRHSGNRHGRGGGVGAGLHLQVEVVDMPGGVPERHAIVVASRHVDFLIGPHVSIIGGVHIPVARMGFTASGHVIVRDGDAGLPAVVAADPAHRGLVDNISVLKGLVDQHLSEGTSCEKPHRE